jgi:hypothetical protein
MQNTTLTNDLQSAIANNVHMADFVNTLFTFNEGKGLAALFCQAQAPAFLKPFIEQSASQDRETTEHAFLDTLLKFKELNSDVISWMSNGIFGEAIVKHKNTNADTLLTQLNVYLAELDQREHGCSYSVNSFLSEVAKNPNIDGRVTASIWERDKTLKILELIVFNKGAAASALEFIRDIIMHESDTIDVPESVTYGYNSRRGTSTMPLKRDNELGKILTSISGHENASVDTLRALFEKENGPARTLLGNESLPIRDALIWSQEENNDDSAFLVGVVAVRVAQAVAQTSDEDNEISPNLPPAELMRKDMAITTLAEYGYNIAQLFDMVKTKQFVRALIGTAHKEEVTFFIQAQTCVLSSISALQHVFTRGQKLDRHGYIEFITQFNKFTRNDMREDLATKIDGGVFDLTGNNLQLAINAIGWDGVLNVVRNQGTIAARDTLNMLASVTYSEYEEETARQITLVNRWLVKEVHLNCINDNKQNEYNSCFHDYLAKKQVRDDGVPALAAPFYQTRLNSLVDGINAQLKARNYEQVLSVFLPANAAELRRIGTAQRHCVGGKNYADQCATGRSVIFAIKVGGSLKHGFTFQYDTHSQSLIQAEGFSASEPAEHLVNISKRVIKALNGDGTL